MTNEEAADALKRLIYPTHAPYHNEVIRLAIAALRTPSATGAAAMREAEKVCSDVYDGYMVAAGRANTEARYDDEKDEMLKADGALRCLSKVRPLPAPEVPEAVKKWARYYDSYSSSRRQWDADPELRDWIRKEFKV